MVKQLQHLQEVFNSLTLATRGRINNSAKKALTYATLGWLIVISDPLPPEPITIKVGGNANLFSEKLPSEKNIILRDIKKDDDELLNILKIFLQCKK